MKTLIITDNEYLYENFFKLLDKLKIDVENFEFRFTYFNKQFLEKYKNNKIFKPINVKENISEICENYHLVLSLHCKQIFPKKLIENVRCINIHPGFNPYNRGWFPQVFSIINSLPVGVTIHEIDEQLDHGAIIAQSQIEINSWETSKCVYDKVLDLEIELLERHLINIITGDYKTKLPNEEGNVNYKSEFNSLCKLNLEEKVTMRESINLLRALTHGDYSNAYFIDELGNKVWVKIQLERDMS